MRSAELKEQRAALVAEARKILDGAEALGRAMNEEENSKWDAIMKDVDARGDEAVKVERQENLERELAQVQERRVPGTLASPGAKGKTTEEAQAEKDEAELRAFITYIRTGRVGDEFRVLQSGSDVEGGFLVPPEQFVNQLLKLVDDAVVIRALATVTRVETAESLGVPTLDTDAADADWTSELLTGAEDTGIRFGKRELRPHPLAKRVKISQKLIRQARFAIEPFIMGRLAFKFGVTQEKAFMTGDGNQKPLGLFVTSANGLSASVDRLTGSATGFVDDNLIDIKYALKPQYWRNARWLFHRDAIAKIRKLKDLNGQYQWQPGLQQGAPDRLLELPIVVSEFVPNTFTTGLFVGMLADFSFYWIADALNMGFQRLIELYAETNQVGFIGRLETDGMPVFEEPFIRIKTD